MASFDSAPIVLGQATLDSLSTRHYGGLMDELRLWNVARSGEEIRRTMNLILEGNEPGLIGRWGFDEEGGQILIDSSPTGNSGYLGKNSSVESGDPVRVVSDAPIHRLPAVNVTPRIEPSVPRTLDDLECGAEAEPIGEGETPPLQWSYRWFRNGAELTQGMEVSGIYHPVTGPTLSHVFTAKNDVLSCSVRVSDGTYSFEQAAAPVTVVNSTPGAPVVKIVPENPTPWSGFAADIQTYSIDPDGDPVNYGIRWYRSQDGGETFVFKAELSGTAPAGTWVPPAYAAEGDLWRVEAIPFEASAQSKSRLATAQEQVEGEMAWWEVYIGQNSPPMVSIVAPGTGDVWVAGNRPRLQWQISDADGDALTLELLYDFDDRIAGALPIARGIARSGSLEWESPFSDSGPDLNSDGRLDWQDLLALSGNWQKPVQDGTRVKIFARVRDAKGAMQEAMSEGCLVFPDSLPATAEGLQEWMRVKRGEGVQGMRY